MESPTPFALYGRVYLFLSPDESSNMAFPDPPGNFLGSMIPVSLDLFHSWWHCPDLDLLILAQTTAAQKLHVFDNTETPSI